MDRTTTSTRVRNVADSSLRKLGDTYSKCTQNTLLSACTSTLFVCVALRTSALMRTAHRSSLRCVRVKKVTVVLSRIPSCTLMSMLNVPFVPFQSLHSSSSASPSRSTTTTPTNKKTVSNPNKRARYLERAWPTDRFHAQHTKRPVRSCYRQEPKDLTAVLIF